MSKQNNLSPPLKLVKKKNNQIMYYRNSCIANNINQKKNLK